MAENNTEKGNIAERGLRFLRNVHIAIGAVALAGAILFPQIEVFSVVAGYEAINALVHEGLRQVVKSRPRPSPQPT